jgi:excisionase family DNA binding protein
MNPLEQHIPSQTGSVPIGGPSIRNAGTKRDINRVVTGPSAKSADILADGLQTVEAAADFLAVGKTTLYKAMERGELPYVKIGRARRIPRRALLNYAANNLRGGWATKSQGGV